MTTNSELCTRPDCEQQSAAPLIGADPRRLPALFWDFALGLGALVCLLLALFDGMDSPLIGLVVIVVVGPPTRTTSSSKQAIMTMRTADAAALATVRRGAANAH